MTGYGSGQGDASGRAPFARGRQRVVDVAAGPVSRPSNDRLWACLRIIVELPHRSGPLPDQPVPLFDEGFGSGLSPVGAGGVPRRTRQRCAAASTFYHPHRHLPRWRRQWSVRRALLVAARPGLI